MNINSRIVIFLYKNFVILFRCWLIADILVFGCFIEPLKAVSLLVLAGGFFLFYLIYMPLLFYQYGRINSILYIYCDPEKYVEIYRLIINGYQSEKLGYNKKTKSLGSTVVSIDKNSLLLQLSSGLLLSGRFDEALGVLDLLRFAKKNLFNKALYHSTLCSYYLNTCQYEKASNVLNNMKNDISALNRLHSKKAERAYYVMLQRLNMSLGNYDTALDFFVGSLKAAKNTFERVNAQYNLAKVYLHSGDIPRAKEAFEYVVTHGNKLHIVEEAKQRLITIKSL